MKASKKPTVDPLAIAAEKKLQSLRNAFDFRANQVSVNEMLEALGIAVVAAIRATRVPQNPPSAFFKEAKEVLDQAKQFMAAQKPDMTAVRFTPAQATKLVPFKDVRYLWQAVRSFFGDDAAEIKERKSFTYEQLDMLRGYRSWRRQENAAGARKALASKKLGRQQGPSGSESREK